MACARRDRPRHTEAVQPRRRPHAAVLRRLEWEKCVQDLIAALARIRRSHPGTRLVVAGKGRHQPELVQDARKARVLRSVDFVGHLTDRQLATALAAADVVVLPSRYEPFGIVALEAAAAGAPLVASTAGGLGEVVVHEETGLSFRPGDVEGLAGAVRAVLDDPAAARRRARAAKARLTCDFDWARIAEATVEVYRGARVTDRGPLGRPKIATGNAFI